KMRKQIRGLDQASTNAEDGISCVQTAEGALNEVQDMLQRMNELAVQAANGTNSENDRSYIQAEIDQLTTEIDRVAETTKFNETYLLKGDGVGGKYVDLGDIEVGNSITLGEQQGGDVAGQTYKSDRDAVLVAANTTRYGQKAEDTIVVAGVSYDLKEYQDIDDLAGAISNNKKVSSVDLAYKNGVSASTDAASEFTLTSTNETTTVSGDVTFEVSSNYTGSSITQTISINDTNAMTIEFTLATKTTKDGTLEYDETTTINNIKAALETQGYSYTESDGVFTVKTQATMTVNAATVVDDLNFNLHVGADGTSSNKINVNIEAMSADGIGISGLKVTSEKNATDAIDIIAQALQQVSRQRSDLGAIQNRLEHTINNLDNVVENTTAAESRIRDTDMAEAMVEYSNLNILAQAGQSMLAQANQSNQGVLSLLQ
ncbi:MAG: flagellin, partial [Succinivibrio sp.]|uniref:flagellin N-terminal helical domain-containing protein n=1 Tax=Succinivibrio sp. TaxID=2053619 RepID=UPI002F95240B